MIRPDRLFCSALAFYCSTSLAAPAALTASGIAGKLEPGAEAHYTVTLQAGDLAHIALASPDWMVGIAGHLPDGTPMAPLYNLAYGNLSNTLRFVAPVAGDYVVDIHNWNTQAAPWQLRLAEHQSAAEYAARLAQFDQWLQKAAQPLSDQVWTNLATQQLASARIVGMGEPSHGGLEPWQDRLALALAMARAGKLRTIALELAYGDVHLLDDYVQGGDTSRRKARSGIQFELFRSDAAMAFYDGIRQYNQNAPHKLHLVGVDIHASDSDGDVIDWLKQVSPSDVDDAKLLMDDKWRALTRRLLTHKASADDARELDQPIAAGQRLLQHLTTNENAWQMATSAQAIERAWLAINGRTRMLEVYRQNFFTMLAQRDAALAERVLWLEHRLPAEEQMLLLAHNTHIGKNVEGYLLNHMGERLARQLGERYVAIGVTFGSGKFEAVNIDSQFQALATFDAGKPVAQSLEEYLARPHPGTAYLLALHGLSGPVADWFGRDISMRTIGGDSRKNLSTLQYETTVPTRDFDWMVFHDQQSAAD